MVRPKSYFLAFVVRTMVAAIVGAFIYAFSVNHGHRLALTQIVGVAIVILTPIAIPTALVANLALFLASKHIGLRLAGWSTVLLIGVICTTTFPIYMVALAPATDWNRAILLPLATFLAAVTLWIAGQLIAAKRPMV